MIDFYAIPLPPDPGLPPKPRSAGVKPPLPPKEEPEESPPVAAPIPQKRPWMKQISLESWRPDRETQATIRKMTGGAK